MEESLRSTHLHMGRVESSVLFQQCKDDNSDEDDDEELTKKCFLLILITLALGKMLSFS